MSNAKHIHKYHRVNTKFKSVWACAGCPTNHFMPEHLTALIIGRNSICWSCGSQFVMTEQIMEWAVKHTNGRPYCDDCQDDMSKLTELLNPLAESK